MHEKDFWLLVELSVNNITMWVPPKLLALY